MHAKQEHTSVVTYKPRAYNLSMGCMNVNIGLGIGAAFSIEMFAKVLQNFLSLVHGCSCETFANCFDTERSHVLPIKPTKSLGQETDFGPKVLRLGLMPKRP